MLVLSGQLRIEEMSSDVGGDKGHTGQPSRGEGGDASQGLSHLYTHQQQSGTLPEGPPKTTPSHGFPLPSPQPLEHT